MKKIGFLLVTVCMVAFFACSTTSENKPEQTVENYLDALKAEKYKKALDYMDLDLDKEEKEQVDMLIEKMKNDADENGNLKNYTITSVEMKESNPDKATVHTTLTYGNGEKEESFKLVKKDGKWKISFSIF